MRTCRIAHRSLTSLDGFITRRARSTSSSSAWCGNTRSVARLLRQTDDVEKTTVQGWVRSIRKQKRVAFAAISDGSTVDSLQAVLTPEDASNLSTGKAVRLKGDWKYSRGAGQSHELQASSVEALGDNDAENNPLQPKYQTAEYLRSIPHLRARTPANALLLRLRSHLIAAITTFFHQHDFVQTHTPIITSSDCEGAGEVFSVSSAAPAQQIDGKDVPAEHFFRSPKYLTVSAQLHLEALALAVNNVWTLSPTFRAEQSDTPRHLSEFYMLEAEMCFVQDLQTVMDLVENMLRAAVTDLQHSPVWAELLKSKQSSGEDADQPNITAQVLQQRWDDMASSNWPRLTYAEAIDILRTAQSSGTTAFVFNPTYEDGLQAEHERYIASTIGSGKPVFVTNYPRVQKPFYMPLSPNAPDTVSCFDLLVPDLCELAGGSLREHRAEHLLRAMEAKGVGGNNLDWYVDLRRYGSVPHGGFGLGFDRLLCYLAGVPNVRDVVAFPRWFGRCEC